MKTRALIIAFALAGAACQMPTELDGSGGGADFVETHRSILEGVVVGAFDQPLSDVRVLVQFPGSSLPAPTTRTDGAGRFTFVLALYNHHGVGADSASAVVYAFAGAPRYTIEAASHTPVLVRFQPVTREPPRTWLSFVLPLY